MNSQGDLIPAAQRDEYFPVYFVEPLAGNEAAMGFDLGSDPARLAALKRARDTGKTVTTQRVTLVQETGEQFGFLAFVPLYSSGLAPDTVAARRDKLTGFARGVFRIGDILQTAMARTTALTNLDIYVLDAAAPPGAALLYYRGALGKESSQRPEHELLLGDYETTKLAVADREWLLVFTPPTGFIMPDSKVPWAVAMFGLLLSVVFVLFLRSSQTRTHATQQTVFERSAELSAVNRALEEEMAERQQADHMLQEQNAALQLIHTLTVAGNKARTVEEAIRVCLEEVCLCTGWPVGHAFHPAEDDSEEFVSAGVWRLGKPDGLEDFVRLSETFRFAPGEGVIGQVVADGKPRWIADVNQDGDFVRTLSNNDLPVKAALFFPFLAGQTVVAVLEFYAFETIEPDSNLLAILTQIGTHLGRAAERVQTARNLRDSEEFVHLITDGLPVVITYFDAELKLRFINKVGVDWFSCPREELIGNPTDDKITAIGTENIQSRKRLVLTGKPQIFDTALTYPDGKHRQVTISYTPHFDGFGVVTGFFGVVQDITQRLEIERQLNQAQKMEKRVFRVEEAITEIEALLQKSTGERYELHIESHTDGACVETDASEFNQALINLVINARDAMPHGGRIEITSRVVELDEEFAEMHQKVTAGRFVEVSVKDYGIGIDANTIEHIFEPFFTTKDQGKGTGLGLAMVYGFAQNSGGAIDVESAIESGATFKIYLPAVDRDPEAVVAEVGEDHLGHGETVLLIEDDPPLLELAREMLDSLGYNVLTACDGFEAMEIEAEYEQEIHLLLSDVVMPTIGGFQLAEMIRDSHPDVKIVFMSGYPNRAGIGNENVPDNCQFLQKPVKPAHLAQALRHELDSTGSGFPG